MIPLLRIRRAARWVYAAVLMVGGIVVEIVVVIFWRRRMFHILEKVDAKVDRAWHLAKEERIAKGVPHAPR